MCVSKHSHCNTCKYLSGSAFTLNQIIPKSALDITKGGDKLGKYTYYGESGAFVLAFLLMATCTYAERQARVFTAITAPIAQLMFTTIKKSWAMTRLCCARDC
jgi:hypothetical protein